jgi:hypothetical protein
LVNQADEKIIDELITSICFSLKGGADYHKLQVTPLSQVFRLAKNVEKINRELESQTKGIR